MDLQLRAWTRTDLPNLVKYANNENIARYMTDSFPHPYMESNAEAFFKMATADAVPRLFAMVVDGEAAGGIGLHPQPDIMRRNMELGYWLGEPFWGRGVVTQAVRKMVEYGFQTFDIDRIYARPFGTNTASQKVLEKAGFTLEARFEKTILKRGELLDELIYAVRRVK